MSRPFAAWSALAAALLVNGSAGAQVCALPDSVRGLVPAAALPEDPYDPLRGSGAPFDTLALGVGHLMYAGDDPAGDAPPAHRPWLQRVELPLSHTPHQPPAAWIAGGWILPAGSPPERLTPDGLLETGYEEQSFIVLEQREDGWRRLRYPTRAGGPGPSWVPDCALRAGPVRLTYAAWKEWFLSGQISPLVLRADAPEPLRAGPSDTSAAVTSIAGAYALEPIEIRGDWMRVVLVEPSDYCDPDVRARRREGWVRWSAPATGPRVWYFTRGC